MRTGDQADFVSLILSGGRGLRSSTFELNLSGFRH